MSKANFETQPEDMTLEPKSGTFHDFEGPFDTDDGIHDDLMDAKGEPSIPDEALIRLMEAYETLKDRMDALQAERNMLREEIQSHMGEKGIKFSEIPVPSGRAYKVSLSSRIIETVTREGKTFIKVNAAPALLESLIKVSERDTLAIREMTGVPRQVLLNRLHGLSS